VLVQGPDRFGGLGGKSELERDRCAAVAPDLDQLARGLRRARDGDELPRAAEHPATRRDRASRLEGESQARVPIDSLHARLHDVVVGIEQRSHAAGVARAAGILQQKA
jgi:hypothetical protein